MGRIRRRAAAAVLAAVAVVALAAGAYAWRARPALDGRLAVAGLQADVQVRRDAADVTHLSAAGPQDLWFALGYVHAQERTWQLEFRRRLMHGTLAEMLGPAALDTDRLMRTLDIRGTARRQFDAMPASSQEALRRYAAGIASWHRQSSQALPPEFHLLGVRPGGDGGEPWSPEDCVGWWLMMALDLGQNWGNELTRLMMAKVLDTERLWQLMPPYPGEAPATAVDLASLYRSLGVYRDGPERAGIDDAPATSAASPRDAAPSAWSRAFVEQAGTSDGRGSNNWVVAGSRTRSGRPLLANDPHLGLVAPALWYFAHLQAPAGTASDGTPIPAIDVIGATLPGLPFVVVGRTPAVAWGVTNTGPDGQDLYLEQIDPADPDRYRTPDGWARFDTRVERIRVKGEPDTVITVRRSRHGPVISDVQKTLADTIDSRRYAVALRWSAAETDNRSVVTGLRVNTARTVDELFEAFADFHSPMQSVVAADTQGTIRMKAVGRVPVRRPDNDLRGVAPAPGWDARYDWQGWLPYAQTPEDDGRAGWIATANHRITPPGYPHFLTQDWSLPYRYERIAHQLAATPQHDVDSMRALQADLTSLAARRLLPHLRRVVSDHPLAPAAFAALQDFDGEMLADRAAPLIFVAWVDELTRGLLVPRVGEARFKATYGRRDFRAAVEGILARDDRWWCGPAGCAAQCAAALGRALDRLSAMQGPDPARWRWGTAHAALSSHLPFGKVPWLAWLFDVRVPTGGDAYTVNVGQYFAGEADGPYLNRHAASLRMIHDLGDPQQSRFSYQTGQSGLVFSPRYRDMAQAWGRVEDRPLQREPGRWAHELTLTPSR